MHSIPISCYTMRLMATIEAEFPSMQSRRDFISFSSKRRGAGGRPPRKPDIGRPSISPEPPDKGGFKPGRRPLIIAGTAFAVGAVAAAVIRPWERFITQSEKDSVPNLYLKIDEAEFWKVVKAGGKFEVLPDATDKSKLLPYSPNIYMGRSSTLFKVGINKPLNDFMIGQSKLLNPPLRTNIIFVEDWGEGDMVSGEGGFTGIKDEKEQNIVIYLKRAAWHAFKAADNQNLTIQDYYQGFISFFTSSWTVHEFGHAGAQTKTLWGKGGQIPQAKFEATHAQIFTFQKQYEALYDQAGKQGLAVNALPVVIEPIVDLDRLRTQINQEARQRGFE